MGSGEETVRQGTCLEGGDGEGLDMGILDNKQEKKSFFRTAFQRLSFRSKRTKSIDPNESSKVVPVLSKSTDLKDKKKANNDNEFKIEDYKHEPRNNNIGRYSLKVFTDKSPRAVVFEEKYDEKKLPGKTETKQVEVSDISDALKSFKRETQKSRETLSSLQYDMSS